MTTRIRDPRPPSFRGGTSRSKRMNLQLESPSFASDEPIPVQHTADGQNLSPALTWSDLPQETRALAILCEDFDAPGFTPFVHWLVADIDPAQVGSMLDQGADSIPGAELGKNSFGRIGYAGPEPPPGEEPHRYHFKLFALDARLGLQEGFSREQLVQSMRDHLLAEGELIGSYGR